MQLKENAFLKEILRENHSFSFSCLYSINIHFSIILKALSKCSKDITLIEVFYFSDTQTREVFMS